MPFARKTFANTWRGVNVLRCGWPLCCITLWQTRDNCGSITILSSCLYRVMVNWRLNLKYIMYKTRSHNFSNISLYSQQIGSCKHSKAFREFLISLGWLVDIDSHSGWSGNIKQCWSRGSSVSTLRPAESSYLQSSHSVSTLTGSEEQEVSGSDSDRYASCR